MGVFQKLRNCPFVEISCRVLRYLLAAIVSTAYCSCWNNGRHLLHIQFLFPLDWASFHLSAAICLFVFMFNVGGWGKAGGSHLHRNNNHQSAFCWRIQVTAPFESGRQLVWQLEWDCKAISIAEVAFHPFKMHVVLVFVHSKESDSFLSRLIRL